MENLNQVGSNSNFPELKYINEQDMNHNIKELCSIQIGEKLMVSGDQLHRDLRWFQSMRRKLWGDSIEATCSKIDLTFAQIIERTRQEKEDAKSSAWCAFQNLTSKLKETYRLLRKDDAVKKIEALIEKHRIKMKKFSPVGLNIGKFESVALSKRTVTSQMPKDLDIIFQRLPNQNQKCRDALTRVLDISNPKALERRNTITQFNIQRDDTPRDSQKTLQRRSSQAAILLKQSLTFHNIKKEE